MSAEILFFGCTGQVGHHLYSKGPRHTLTETPFKYEVDTGYLQKAKIPDSYCNSSPPGQWVEVHKGGWTAISFWDRSGPDTRPGCNTAFLINAHVTGTELMTLARGHWPEIFLRRGFPLLQPEPVKVITEDVE